MKAILPFLLASSSNLPTAVFEAPWGVEKISRTCESIYGTSIDDRGTLLTFVQAPLRVDSDAKVSYLSCTIVWRPDLPLDKRLKSAELSVEGRLSANGKAQGTLHLGHRLLGLSTSPSMESWILEEGPYSRTIEVQNIADHHCGAEAKIVSSFRVLLKRSDQWGADDAVPALSIDSLRLGSMSWEDCPASLPPALPETPSP